MRALLDAGVAGIRFPFSKESPSEHADRGGLLRKLADDIGRKVYLLADLPGGKPRLSNHSVVKIDRCRAYQIAYSQFGDPLPVAPNFEVIPALTQDALAPGDLVWIGDGEDKFIVETIAEGVATGTFETGGLLQPTRAFAPASSSIGIQSITLRDYELARAAASARYDGVALSFVEDADDVDRFRAWLKSELAWSPELIAKIETRRGVRKAAEICVSADRILVGRGDLAFGVGFTNLWAAQKAVLETCQRSGTYSIVGTGLLDGLQRGGLPTRAQCIDIASTLEMGADALLLSAETTIGEDPAATAALLRRHIEAWRSDRIV